MKTKDFYVLLKQMVKDEETIMIGKGKEYTIGSDDKLQNFKDVGKASNLDPMKVWQVYFMKHVASIYNYIKDGVEASDEPIEGRIKDARNYLALLVGLIKEQKDLKEEYVEVSKPKEYIRILQDNLNGAGVKINEVLEIDRHDGVHIYAKSKSSKLTWVFILKEVGKGFEYVVGKEKKTKSGHGFKLSQEEFDKYEELEGF